MIDSHCHLEHSKFNRDLDEVIERASSLKAIITLSDSFSSNQKTLNIAEKYSTVHACLGTTPITALRENRVDECIEFMRGKKFLAVGEVGLDYYWDKNNHDKQKENLLKFIELANELNKPIVIHSRNAEKDALELVEKKADTQVIMHMFEGSSDLIKRAVDNNFFIGVSTKLSWKGSDKSLINTIPLDYMLTETDSPYLHPMRKERNEPVEVKHLIELISQQLEQPFDLVDKTTEKNAIKAFKL